MRILYVTTIGITMTFFKSLIQELVDSGHTVDIATNDSESRVDSFYSELGCEIITLSCSRSPLNKDNITAIKQIKKLVQETKYDIVHCHTPVAAMCTRIACRKVRKKGTKVFYTAHGFHFFKGAPLKNWLLYYPVEWLCAFLTDTLITINKEDYTRAQKHMHAKRVGYVPGVGIDVEKFANTQVDRATKRQELGIPEDAFLLLSVGELNENKNHQIVIRAMAELKDPNIHYAIAGIGNQHDDLKNLARQLEMSDKLHLWGYCNDVAELYKTANVYILPSLREGLNVSVMEAMASGLPCIVSRIRGNVDLIDEQGGGLFDSRNIEELQRTIGYVLRRNRNACGKYNREKVNMFSAETCNTLLLSEYIK